MKETAELIAELQNAGALADVRALLREISREFGGPEGLARELHLLYEAAPKGAGTRARIMSDIMGLWARFSDGAEGDAGVTTEDIEAELRVLLKSENS